MTQIEPRTVLSHLARIGGLALCAATIAACGGGDGDAEPSAARAVDDSEGPLKFAKCMREHGIDMPDPKVSADGRVALTLKGGPKSGNADADLDKAQAACQKLMGPPSGKRADPAEQAKHRDAVLAYARCMREHDVDMPDPEFGGSGGRMTTKMHGKGGSSPNPDTPQFKAADEACRDLLGAQGGGPAFSPSAP